MAKKKPQFAETENRIRNLFSVGTSFEFEGCNYEVLKCAKPRPSSGECKTDIYLLVRSFVNNEKREIKISIKQKNADFLENKMSYERAIEIFGNSADDILRAAVNSIEDNFNQQKLVYFNKFGKTEANTIKLGWKFELTNKKQGDLSGEILLTREQVEDVYFGINLPEDKKNSMIDNELIENSGVANYILVVDSNEQYTLETCLQSLTSKEDFLNVPQTLYFACKALNYRADKNKWDGDRPLSVYVDWKLRNGKLKGKLITDSPLLHKGNEIGENVKVLLNELSINKNNFGNLKALLDDSVEYYELK